MGTACWLMAIGYSLRGEMERLLPLNSGRNREREGTCECMRLATGWRCGEGQLFAGLRRQEAGGNQESEEARLQCGVGVGRVCLVLARVCRTPSLVAMW